MECNWSVALSCFNAPCCCESHCLVLMRRVAARRSELQRVAACSGGGGVCSSVCTMQRAPCSVQCAPCTVQWWRRCVQLQRRVVGPACFDCRCTRRRSEPSNSRWRDTGRKAPCRPAPTSTPTSPPTNTNTTEISSGQTLVNQVGHWDSL